MFILLSTGTRQFNTCMHQHFRDCKYTRLVTAYMHLVPCESQMDHPYTPNSAHNWYITQQASQRMLFHHKKSWRKTRICTGWTYELDHMGKTPPVIYIPFTIHVTCS